MTGKQVSLPTWMFLLAVIFLVNTSIGFAQFEFGGRQPSTKKPTATETVDDDFETDADEEQDSEDEEVKDEKKLEPEDNGPRYGRSATKTWKTGVRLKAVSRCFDMVFLIPIPVHWPEQEVTILEENASNEFAVIERRPYKSGSSGHGGLGLMVVKVKDLQPGRSTEASLMVKATRREVLPPTPESIAKLRIPPRIPKDLQIYIDSTAQIQSGNARFKKLYRDITKDIKSDWEKIEAIYKYVQENIEYNEANKTKNDGTALGALKKGNGDCKEMTAVFNAICRAGRIPARTVWIPGHCYSEFYMVDDNGRGYWFPCQVSGTYAFGGIPEMEPVLQKGDEFKFKEFKGEKFRNVAPQVIGQNEGGSGEKPKCEFFGIQYTSNR